MKKWSNEEIKTYIGDPTGCYISHANLPSVRREAASGGSMTQVCIDLINQRLVHGILCWLLDFEAPEPKTRACIAQSEEEILAARGSKYCSVNYPRDALPVIQDWTGGPLAVIALPCDATYLRRKMRLDPELKKKIGIILTPFCGHNSKPELTSLFLERHGFKWNELTSFKYRTGRWRGQLTIRDQHERTKILPTSSFTHYQNLHFFSERKCLNCIDHFGFDGDLCFGDSWSRKMRREDIKPTLILVRNQEGERALAAAKPHLALNEIEPKSVADGNSRGMVYHYNVSARAKAAKRFGITIKDVLKLRVNLLERLIAFLGVFNYWLSTKPFSQKLIKVTPFWIIRAYVFLFKGLQQLNLSVFRPLPPKHRIAIIGATLTGNRGAEAMLVTTIGRLRHMVKGASFVVFSYFPKDDAALCHDLDIDVLSATPASLVFKHFPFSIIDRLLSCIGLNWPKSWMPREARALAQTHLLVDISGISFADGRGKLLPFNILNNLPAMLFKTPVVKLAQSIGSFKQRKTAFCARPILRRCLNVFARGGESTKFVSALAADINVAESSDIAFLFEGAFTLTDEHPQHAEDIIKRLKRRNKVIAVSVSTVVAKKERSKDSDYLVLVTQTCRQLLEQGYSVWVYANANRADIGKHHNNDLPICQYLSTQIHHESFLVQSKTLNTAALRSILSQCDIQIASRFHGMIAGLSLGIPTLVVGWSHKYRELLGQFELESWAFDYKDVTCASLVKTTNELFAQRDDLKKQILDRLPAVKAVADQQFQWLDDWFTPTLDPCTVDA